MIAKFAFLAGLTLPGFAQDTLHLTVKEAERIALQNNPQVSSA